MAWTFTCVWFYFHQVLSFSQSVTLRMQITSLVLSFSCTFLVSNPFPSPAWRSSLFFSTSMSYLIGKIFPEFTNLTSISIIRMLSPSCSNMYFLLWLLFPQNSLAWIMTVAIMIILFICKALQAQSICMDNGNRQHTHWVFAVCQIVNVLL